MRKTKQNIKCNKFFLKVVFFFFFFFKIVKAYYSRVGNELPEVSVNFHIYFLEFKPKESCWEISLTWPCEVFPSCLDYDDLTYLLPIITSVQDTYFHM